MRIAIISDTHLNHDTTKLEVLLDRLGPVDFILHAGDYTGEGVVKILQATAMFYGVWGNADSSIIQDSLKEKEIITFGSYRLGIFHGHGTGKCTVDRAYAAFENENLDIIVFGHSHQPLICTKNKVLMLNPGSPTNKRTQRWFTCIVLDLLSTSIEAKIIFLDNIDTKST
ncbi:metallophosphoesterase [Sporomusa sp.]|uniref:metallophosphoesterase family protein n=1 Tax=Sporomusa sp. TaxID=2078658 RepID=UPI002CAD86D4|nr:metallophosphoesterase [Sporomusa sp.]HWR42770.1 metallophosphoesterase [Sporomusa sp.]